MGEGLRLILQAIQRNHGKEAESSSQPIRGPHLMFSANQNTPIAAKRIKYYSNTNSEHNLKQMDFPYKFNVD